MARLFGSSGKWALVLFGIASKEVQVIRKNVIPDERSEAREIRNAGKRRLFVNFWIPDRALSRTPIRDPG